MPVVRGLRACGCPQRCEQLAQLVVLDGQELSLSDGQLGLAVGGSLLVVGGEAVAQIVGGPMGCPDGREIGHRGFFLQGRANAGRV